MNEVLNQKLINLNLEASNKNEVFYKLAKLLKQENYITDIDKFVEDIYLREQEGITGIGNNIAIPHGKSSEVKKIGVAIGRTKNMIEWESIDDKPVNLIFLFCVSNDDNYAKNHLKILSQVAMKLGDDELVEKLKTTKTIEEFLKLMSD